MVSVFPEPSWMAWKGRRWVEEGGVFVSRRGAGGGGGGPVEIFFLGCFLVDFFFVGALVGFLEGFLEGGLEFLVGFLVTRLVEEDFAVDFLVLLGGTEGVACWVDPGTGPGAAPEAAWAAWAAASAFWARVSTIFYDILRIYTCEINQMF